MKKTFTLFQTRNYFSNRTNIRNIHLSLITNKYLHSHLYGGEKYRRTELNINESLPYLDRLPYGNKQLKINLRFLLLFYSKIQYKAW